MLFLREEANFMRSKRLLQVGFLIYGASCEGCKSSNKVSHCKTLIEKVSLSQIQSTTLKITIKMPNMNTTIKIQKRTRALCLILPQACTLQVSQSISLQKSPKTSLKISTKLCPVLMTQSMYKVRFVGPLSSESCVTQSLSVLTKQCLKLRMKTPCKATLLFTPKIQQSSSEATKHFHKNMLTELCLKTKKACVRCASSSSSLLTACRCISDSTGQQSLVTDLSNASSLTAHMQHTGLTNSSVTTCITWPNSQLTCRINIQSKYRYCSTLLR
ncbi:unnamed protein product [Moneuplotes crassus]|uniref:Uncharacterized protein n=1 Tax=Euplotes crassus TaxID=5936 RepID=A0AAD1XG27_EUPCR|nr:unnamed protein product [Moneuplotes crassus]